MEGLLTEYHYPSSIFELKRFLDLGFTVIETKHSSESIYAYNTWESIIRLFQHTEIMVVTHFLKGNVRCSKPEQENEPV